MVAYCLWAIVMYYSVGGAVADVGQGDASGAASAPWPVEESGAPSGHGMLMWMMGGAVTMILLHTLGAVLLAVVCKRYWAWRRRSTKQPEHDTLIREPPAQTV
ncbi:Uncharacterized protein PBTT_08262 [Plasmodiophora brassicae]